MDKYIYDDKNGLWYELQGDYYIPCLILPAEKEQPIGLWGQRHLRYLKEYHRNTSSKDISHGGTSKLQCKHLIRQAVFAQRPNW